MEIFFNILLSTIGLLCQKVKNTKDLEVIRFLPTPIASYSAGPRNDCTNFFSRIQNLRYFQ